MKKDTPLISVILPVYNGEEHLSECIESVLSQTFKDFEFIIVNDASTDNTVPMLKEFATKDNRIIIVTHEESIARHAKRVIHMRDGKILSDQLTDQSS